MPANDTRKKFPYRILFATYRGDMTVTKTTRSLILRRFRNDKLPKLTQAEVAEKMGFGKSWMTKLLNGTIKHLAEDHVEKLEGILGIRLQVVTEKGALPEAAVKLGKMMQSDESVANMVTAIAELLEERREEGSDEAEIPYLSVREIEILGAEVTRIVHQWEDQSGKYYPKVGVETVKALSGILAARKK